MRTLDAYWLKMGEHCVPMTRAEEEALYPKLLDARRRLGDGDEAARDELERIRNRFVRSAMRFAIRLAAKASHALPIEDGVQAASEGLMHAFDKFDPDRGVRFLTYGVWWMRAHLEIAAHGMRGPVALPRRAGVVMRQARTEGEPRSQSDRAILRAMQQPALALDAFVDPPARPEFEMGGDAIELAVERRILATRVSRALRRLDARSRDIIRRRFGFGGRDPEPLVSIGERHGLSRERIRQIEKRALALIRPALTP